eukprot:Cvel_23217.t1-p1 / transcript=Cvel_23217.t1 / gene=Cvel_23217 / organism=Chromera_velia_CCMP2878 / gene_product=hypothetical protein / transcript_product=hypothetical protein / location=Cvel_scaffold2368:75-1846(-) / protein_length=590 / sequence_SO=supercontig / SO=protein_coding / is_pseudo=false
MWRAETHFLGGQPTAARAGSCELARLRDLYDKAWVLQPSHFHTGEVSKAPLVAKLSPCGTYLAAIWHPSTVYVFDLDQSVRCAVDAPCEVLMGCLEDVSMVCCGSFEGTAYAMKEGIGVKISLTALAWFDPLHTFAVQRTQYLRSKSVAKRPSLFVGGSLSKTVHGGSADHPILLHLCLPYQSLSRLDTSATKAAGDGDGWGAQKTHLPDSLPPIPFPAENSGNAPGPTAPLPGAPDNNEAAFDLTAEEEEGGGQLVIPAPFLEAAQTQVQDSSPSAEGWALGKLRPVRRFCESTMPFRGEGIGDVSKKRDSIHIDSTMQAGGQGREQEDEEEGEGDSRLSKIVTALDTINFPLDGSPTCSQFASFLASGHADGTLTLFDISEGRGSRLRYKEEWYPTSLRLDVPPAMRQGRWGNCHKLKVTALALAVHRPPPAETSIWVWLATFARNLKCTWKSRDSVARLEETKKEKEAKAAALQLWIASGSRDGMVRATRLVLRLRARVKNLQKWFGRAATMEDEEEADFFWELVKDHSSGWPHYGGHQGSIGSLSWDRIGRRLVSVGLNEGDGVVVNNVQSGETLLSFELSSSPEN